MSSKKPHFFKKFSKSTKRRRSLKTEHHRICDNRFADSYLRGFCQGRTMSPCGGVQQKKRRRMQRPFTSDSVSSSTETVPTLVYAGSTRARRGRGERAWWVRESPLRAGSSRTPRVRRRAVPEKKICQPRERFLTFARIPFVVAVCDVRGIRLA